MAEVVVIIAPAGVRVPSFPGHAVRRFLSVRDFERWRAGEFAPPTNIAAFVRRSLHAVGHDEAARAGPLKPFFSWLCRCERTPHLKAAAQTWTSYRSFYRTWRAVMRETPAAFLARVRAYHAEELLAHGMLPNAAAHRAGYSSAKRMQIAVQLHGTT